MLKPREKNGLFPGFAIKKLCIAYPQPRVAAHSHVKTWLDVFRTGLFSPGNLSNVDAYHAVCDETMSFLYVFLYFILPTFYSR